MFVSDGRRRLADFFAIFGSVMVIGVGTIGLFFKDYQAVFSLAAIFLIILSFLMQKLVGLKSLCIASNNVQKKFFILFGCSVLYLGMHSIFAQGFLIGFQRYQLESLVSVGLFYLGVTLFRPNMIPRMLQLLSIGGLIITLVLVFPAFGGSSYQSFYALPHGSWLVTGLALGVSYMAALTLSVYTGKVRWAVVGIAIFIGIWISHERSSLIFSIILSIIILSRNWRTNISFFWVLVVGFIVFVFILQDFAPTLSRFSIYFSDQLSISGELERLSLYKNSLVSFFLNPVFGVGPGVERYAHNFILQILSELGLVGAIIFFPMLLLPWVLAFRGGSQRQWQTSAVFYLYLFTLLQYSKGHSIYNGRVFFLFSGIYIACSIGAVIHKRHRESSQLSRLKKKPVSFQADQSAAN